MAEANNDKRIIAPEGGGEDDSFDQTLRPKNLGEYVGQEKTKTSLGIGLQAARQRGEPVDHILLYGPPGLGKTTLAHIIANEQAATIKVTSGPAIEKSGDLAAILTNLSEGDILFIDEIHRLNRTIEEILYPAMEDFALDIIIGKGPSARTLRIDLPRFTIVGATTKVSLLSPPLRDRFGQVFHLSYYEPADIERIVRRSARILGVALDQASGEEIARRSRRTPRVANRLLRRVRDFAEVRGNGEIGLNECLEAFRLYAVDHLGLDDIDRRLLEVIIDKFAGGPVGLSAIAAATGEDMDTIEEVYEPYLMQLGFLDRSPRGRIVTDIGYRHLGRQKPGQDKIF